MLLSADNFLGRESGGHYDPVIILLWIMTNSADLFYFVLFFYAEMTPPRAVTMTTTVTVTPSVQITPRLTNSPMPGTHLKCRVV